MGSWRSLLLRGLGECASSGGDDDSVWSGVVGLEVRAILAAVVSGGYKRCCCKSFIYQSISWAGDQS